MIAGSGDMDANDRQFRRSIHALRCLVAVGVVGGRFLADWLGAGELTPRATGLTLVWGPLGMLLAWQSWIPWFVQRWHERYGVAAG